MKKIALILSGCGVFDGSEIHETVSAMIAITREGAQYYCLAPNISQYKVTNHVTQEDMNETRNVLIESARIARGDIKDITKANIDDYDAAFYPGGFGAAVNLSDFAVKGADMTVQTDVLAFAKAMAAAGKPQGFCCIAPALVSKIYGAGVTHTIGSDPETAAVIEAMGGKHKTCSVTEAVVDKQHKVVTTPAYMLAQNIGETADGVAAAIHELVAIS
ncbi:MAG: isoprenoid biosynthesis glyoxalase ElbB [Gammaproteobacteria bacterium]|nr:isoprenoid biosynthesis glyoxalase ElbB [Gammaproteobacteria bacterium]